MSSIFCFAAFSGASQRWEFKNTTSKFVQNVRVEMFYKTIGKQSETETNIFSIFGRFSARGVRKHHKNEKPIEKMIWSWSFFGPVRPTHPQRGSPHLL
jgi:hypothetical protein